MHPPKFVQIEWGHHVNFCVWKKSAITFGEGCILPWSRQWFQAIANQYKCYRQTFVEILIEQCDVAFNSRCFLYGAGLTFIPTWLNNHIRYNVWDENTYPFGHSQTSTVAPLMFCGDQQFNMGVITYSYQGQSWSTFVTGVPWERCVFAAISLTT